MTQTHSQTSLRIATQGTMEHMAAGGAQREQDNTDEAHTHRPAPSP